MSRLLCYVMVGTAPVFCSHVELLVAGFFFFFLREFFLFKSISSLKKVAGFLKIIIINSTQDVNSEPWESSRDPEVCFTVTLALGFGPGRLGRR